MSVGQPIFVSTPSASAPAPTAAWSSSAAAWYSFSIETDKQRYCPMELVTRLACKNADSTTTRDYDGLAQVVTTASDPAPGLFFV